MASLIKTKGKRLLSFSQKELASIFGTSVKMMIHTEITKRELNKDGDIEKVGVDLASTLSQDRDIHEIFVALFGLSDFYDESTEVCFEVKDDFDLATDSIATIDDVNKYRVTDSDSDFVFKTGGELRYFQVKRYRGELENNSIVAFIKKKMLHYGNDLAVNLVMIIQSPEDKSKYFDSRIISNEVKALNLKSKAEILISHFTYGGEHKMVRVYPELAGAKKPIKLPSFKLRELGLE